MSNSRLSSLFLNFFGRLHQYFSVLRLTRLRPYYYLGRDVALTRLKNGLPFLVHTRDRAISTWLILGGSWERHVDDILCGVTKPGDVVLDAGANQGYYAVKLANIVGSSGKVAAFEPNPELYDILAANISINGFGSRAVPFQMALGAASGRAAMTFDYNNMGGGSLHALGHAQPLEVDVVRGDDVLSEFATFDVMKFDVEGSEPDASLGLTETLNRSAGAAIVVEVYPPGWAHQGEFSEILGRFRTGGKLGFEILAEGTLKPLALDNGEELAKLAARQDAFYLLLMPPMHWAMSFVRSKYVKSK